MRAALAHPERDTAGRREQPARPTAETRPLSAAAVVELQRSAGNRAVAGLIGGAAARAVMRAETGSGLDDPLYMEDRKWSSGQGPDDRITGTRLRNWAIARGSFVIRSEAALKRMQEKDGAEAEIVTEIYTLLLDLLRGATPAATSHVQVDGGRHHPYPIADQGRTKLDRFEGSQNARERAVLELADHWSPIEAYLTQALTNRFNNEYLDAYGRSPSRDMEVESDTTEVALVRGGRHADVWKGGYAPLGGTNTWRVGDRVGRGTVVGISLAQSTFWSVLDRHPLWYYRGPLSLLGSQNTFVGTVAAQVYDQAKFAGMLWPMMIKAAGFALSFSPVPAIMLAGAVFEAFGEEGIRDLTGEGQNFRDVSAATARQLVVDLALNKLLGGGGSVANGGTDAARALERAVEASALRVRDAVKEGIEKSEGERVASALSAGRGRRVSDETLRGEGFLDEVSIRHEGGEHTFRRKGDGSWCRWSKRRICNLKLPPANNILGPPRTGKITSDAHPRFKDQTVYDVKKASSRADDQAEVRMAELFERDGHHVHWNANDSNGDYLIDGVATDTKLLTQTGSITGAVKRANSQGRQVIIDGTAVNLTRQDTERLIAEFQAQAAKHPGPYRNIDTIYVVEGGGTIYIHKRDTALRVDGPPPPTVRSDGSGE